MLVLIGILPTAYKTCQIFKSLLFTLFMFSVLVKNFHKNTVKHLILLGGGIAVFESYLSEYVHVLKYPGVPWSADTVLLALVYLGIGYYYKKPINMWMGAEERKFDIAAIGAVITGAVFCFVNYQRDSRLYYFDMKPLYYRELLMAVAVPCVFGVILLRLAHWFDQCVAVKWIKDLLCVLGQMTIPIMFLHVPLNAWKDIAGYGLGLYCLIGIGIPVLFSCLCSRFGVMRKLFGLPLIVFHEVQKRKKDDSL